jgi:E3 ubiquitin-protein ligase DOA10
MRYRQIVAGGVRGVRGVTEEEALALREEGELCIVCREWLVEDRAGAGPAEAGLKRLHCGHVLHENCLLQWMQHQQACPICRLPVGAGGRQPEDGT